jgi:glycosyltransferase involved in cell wall biosynthesis
MAHTGDPSRDSLRTIRLCILATIGKSIQVLYAGRLEHLTANGFDITVACASSEDDDAILARGVRLKTFPLTRAITPWQDVRALLQMYWFFRKECFDLVEVSTPKAALIGSVAAWLARCPCQIHILHGMPYEGKRGLLGRILRASTSIPCRLAHVTFAVSASMRERLCADGLARPSDVRVLGAGSANGVDVGRFSPERIRLRDEFRAKHSIPADAIVIGFVGRFTGDKGINELVRAFVAVHEHNRKAVLLLIGDYEERDRPAAQAIRTISAHPRIRHVGFQSDVIPGMAAMDIFALPTHREGLGNVLLEAAALGLPTITTDATGARDAILAGTTGVQVPVGDADALAQAVLKLAGDPALREQMGHAGRAWVCENFDQRDVWQRQIREYRTLVAAVLNAPITARRIET